MENEPVSFYNPDYKRTYYLYQNSVRLNDGKRYTTYYFSKLKAKGALEKIPDGWEAVISPRSRMFFLRKCGGKNCNKKHIKKVS